LHNLLWEAGCALDSEVYKAKRAELKDVCEDANTWIDTSLKDQELQWALSRDEGSRFCI